MLGLLRAVEAASFTGVSLEGSGRETRAKKAILRALRSRGPDLISYFPPVAPVRDDFHRRARRQHPDLCLVGYPASDAIAVEIKVTRVGGNENAEVNRGIGQCFTFGTSFCEPEPYGAAALVVARRVPSGVEASTRTVGIAEVTRAGWPASFWMFHFQRDVPPTT